MKMNVVLLDDTKRLPVAGIMPDLWKNTPWGYVKVFRMKDPSRLMRHLPHYRWYVACPRGPQYDENLSIEGFALYKWRPYRFDYGFDHNPERIYRNTPLNDNRFYAESVEHIPQNIFRLHGTVEQRRDFPNWKDLNIYGIGLPRHKR